MSFLGQEAQLRDFQDRFKYFVAALLIGMGFIVSRLVYLQILNGDKMRRYSDENRVKRIDVPAPRGMIFDRERTLLVDNRPSFDVEIVPQYLKSSGESEQVISKLGSLINMDPAEIEDKLSKKRFQPSFLPIKIKKDLPREEVAKVESWKIGMPGVSTKVEIQRTNVFGDIASHLVGYIGKINGRELKRYRSRGYSPGDSIGKVGIERKFESTLRGDDGYQLVEVDALGRRIRGSKDVVLTQTPERSVQPGNNIILTVDQDLQLKAAEAFGDIAGSLVAINPKTGEILSMISRPSFDATEFSRGISSKMWSELTTNSRRPLRDKTIQDHYSPGSVFKFVTAIAALEENIINKNTHFNCKGSMRVGRRVYHCHKRGGHGDVDVVEALEKSCDVFFFRVAQKMESVDVIANWAKQFGFGEKTNIELDAEVPGLVPTEAWKEKRYKEPWNAGESLSVAIGQSFVLSTTLQLANAYAAIANGGRLYRPYFIKSIEGPDGEKIEEGKPKLIREIQLSQENLDLVKKGLNQVVNEPGATAYWSRLPGMNMSGKTGTAQVIRLTADELWLPCEKMKYEHRHNAIFAGYAPADDPEIAVAVIAEHACGGSTGAAPIVKEVINAYLRKKFPEKYNDEVLKPVFEKDRKQMVAYLKARKSWQERRHQARAQDDSEGEGPNEAVSIETEATDEESNPGGGNDVYERRNRIITPGRF